MTEIFEQVKPKAIFARDVRQDLNYVETGNVDAGIVYASDAKISDKVKVVATAPTNSHSPVVYPVAIVKNTRNAKLAEEFINFLSQGSSRKVFANYGFELAE